MMLYRIISGDLAVYATDKTNAAHFALLIKFLISSWSRHRQANDDDFVVGRITCRFQDLWTWGI